MVNTQRSQPRSQQSPGSGSSGGSGNAESRPNALAGMVAINARASLKLAGMETNCCPDPELVAGGKVDQVVRRLAAPHALDVLDDPRDRGARLGQCCRVRSNGDRGMS